MPPSDASVAAELMQRFATRSGLEGDAAPVRYLWTDAFAACNFQDLADAGFGAHFEALAQRTVAQVHRVLGHFRPDDARQGWLRGAAGSADAHHPTRAGLRIGKPLPERHAGEPFDEQLEWQRDGQYFHYLTRWMLALDHLARRRRQPQLAGWARELADAAHRAFTHAVPGGRKRMVWKMSTDLSRPLVPSMGQHDPLDGLIAALSLAAGPRRDPHGPSLEAAIADYASMLEHRRLATGDPLGLGGLLMGARQLARVLHAGHEAYRDLLDGMLESASISLPHCRLRLEAPAEARLGFREIGLAIGLSSIERLADEMADRSSARDLHTRHLVEALRVHVPLRRAIHAFWLAPAHREATSWTVHRDINEVMLASSLLKSGLPR